MYSFKKIFKTAPETSSSSFLSIQLFLHLKEQLAEHFSSFSAKPIPFLAQHLFLDYRCDISEGRVSSSIWLVVLLQF